MVEHRPILDQWEEQTRLETRRLESPALEAIELLLNSYLSGFGELGTFQLTDSNRREQVWLLLTTRTFNSLRWAFHLLVTGYYSQSLTLIRMAAEDWLYSEDSKEHEETIGFLLERKGKTPYISTMANRLENDLKEAWQGQAGKEGSYSFLCSFAHPNYRGMAALSNQEGGLNLGPSYHETYFLATAEYLLIRLIRSMEFLGLLVESVSPQSPWLDDPGGVMAKGHSAREEINTRSATLLEAADPDVDPA